MKKKGLGLLALAGFLLITSALLLFPMVKDSARAEGEDGKVVGWMWSSNVGWVKLDSNTNNPVKMSGGGVLSGYAWSSNIGWINFNPENPPAPSHGVKVDMSASGDIKDVIGWARACSVYVAGCSGQTKDINGPVLGGWDGWIKMTNVKYNVSNNRFEANSFAWGSLNLGWLKFYDGSGCVSDDGSVCPSESVVKPTVACSAVVKTYLDGHKTIIWSSNYEGLVGGTCNWYLGSYVNEEEPASSGGAKSVQQGCNVEDAYFADERTRTVVFSKNSTKLAVISCTICPGCGPNPDDPDGDGDTGNDDTDGENLASYSCTREPGGDSFVSGQVIDYTANGPSFIDKYKWYLGGDTSGTETSVNNKSFTYNVTEPITYNDEKVEFISGSETKESVACPSFTVNPKEETACTFSLANSPASISIDFGSSDKPAFSKLSGSIVLTTNCSSLDLSATNFPSGTELACSKDGGDTFATSSEDGCKNLKDGNLIGAWADPKEVSGLDEFGCKEVTISNSDEISKTKDICLSGTAIN